MTIHKFFCTKGHRRQASRRVFYLFVTLLVSITSGFTLSVNMPWPLVEVIPWWTCWWSSLADYLCIIHTGPCGHSIRTHAAIMSDTSLSVLLTAYCSHMFSWMSWDHPSRTETSLLEVDWIVYSSWSYWSDPASLQICVGTNDRSRCHITPSFGSICVIIHRSVQMIGSQLTEVLKHKRLFIFSLWIIVLC